MIVINYTSPVKRITGRMPYLEATKRFYPMITALEVKDLVVDGNKACALTRYEPQPPSVTCFKSHIAEVLYISEYDIA